MSTDSNLQITAADLAIYHAAFKTHNPTGSVMSGEKAKLVLLQSNLPRETLGKIWFLADHDRDGNLTSDEFAIAMFLMSLCKRGVALPVTLPPVLTPPFVAMDNNDPINSSAWVVTDEAKVKYDSYFTGIDKDHDGFVTGEEVRPFFIASNVPQATLAHIWMLCDIDENGKLNCEQFALAMFLIAEKVRGKDPPKKLTPPMFPPSSRNRVPSTPVVTTVTSANKIAPGGGYAAIKELDTLHGDVDQLTREKAKIKQEVMEKQEAIQSKRTEIDSLESQLEQCNREQQELDAQRQLANQQLAQLEQQKGSVAMELETLQLQLQAESAAVQRLKDQLIHQEEATKVQQNELNTENKQLRELQQEERTLQAQVESGGEELQKAQEMLKSSQNGVAQAKHRVQELKEQQRSISASLALCQPLPHLDVTMPTGNGDDTSSIPTLESDAVSHVATAGSSSPVSSISGFSETLQDDGKEATNEKRPDSSHDPFNDATGHDPFSSLATDTTSDGRDHFGSKDSFDTFAQDPFKQQGRHDNPFESDPFQSSTKTDPFSMNAGGFQATPFDPFATGSDPFTTPPPRANTSSGFDDAFAGSWGDNK